MKVNFDLEKIAVTEFGLGMDVGDEQSFVLLPVDGNVQEALRQMALATWAKMQEEADGPTKYEPSEKHSATEYVYLPLNDALAASMRALHEAANLPLDANAHTHATEAFCYFARMTDNKGRRLSALRRATQFKGILKSRLLQFVTDSLRIVKDDVFKLDNDFDLLIDSTNVHILRPSGFEFAGRLQEAILAAVPQNISVIEKDMAFVEFAGIREFAAKHPRAARLLASIRGEKETKSIDRSALRRFCKAMGVEIRLANGKVRVVENHEMGFLEVLDRRRYEVHLVKDSPERFRAGSRRRIEE